MYKENIYTKSTQSTIQLDILERSVYVYVLFEKMESKVDLFRVVHLSIHNLDISDALIEELHFFG